ncbi:MAG TPA: NAD-dependent epimerase/dehydratase family protein [Candidatus Limnocylindria bacterium]|nr:NAD-dependent epimerase/dehydratase family protein [Candidatus Limnocylindria bacterium]
MKALIIGGTGTISSAVTRLAANSPDWELFLFNRGNRPDGIPGNVTSIRGDATREDEAAALLHGLSFDCVAQFTGREPEQAMRDIRLFRGRTKQYIFISTAAAYQTPPPHPFITEGMLQNNPFWEYARKKIECERLLLEALREDGFPVTIVRPSHTYSEDMIPFCLQPGPNSWPVIKRMMDGKRIIVPGDGSSLWTVTFNEDFARGFMGLMGNPHAVGEAVHITTDESLTWNQMAQAVADELGVDYKPYYVPTDALVAMKPELGGGLNGDKRHSVVYDNAKIKRLVPGFHATVTWRTGVHRAMRKILATPSLRPEDPAFDRWCDRVIAIYDEALEKAREASGDDAT